MPLDGGSGNAVEVVKKTIAAEFPFNFDGWLPVFFSPIGLTNAKSAQADKELL